MDIVNRNCPECGNQHPSEDIDLWTRCEACYSLLITDDEVFVDWHPNGATHLRANGAT